MATHDNYLAYKRDTSLLLRWMLQTSNDIIKTQMSKACEEQPHKLNKTGQIVVADIIPLCHLIAKYVTNISPSIYRLFQSIIDARTASYSMFQMIAVESQDKDIEKSNSTHKFFIDTLVEALKVLGGSLSKSGASQHADHGTSSVTKEEVEQLIFANRFAALQNDKMEESSEDEVSQQSSTNQSRKQTRPGKKKNGKKGKKHNHKRQEPSLSGADLKNLPLEDYKFIEQDLQEVWRDVAYKDLNVAIGGALSNFAIATVQRRSTEIFVNFPDHDSYGSIMDAATCGVSHELQGKLLSMLWLFTNCESDQFMPSQETDYVDSKEQLLLNAYEYLVDFIIDFQHTRSGKPTKRMLAELNTWDPSLNLQKATKAERFRWRRSYTINWLYEMVNTLSSSHPQHRKILGLQEFASFVTYLAMQKPGSNFRHKILPHHVFQLQLMVDSMTISRGWAQNYFRGDMLAPPPNSFDPQHVIKDEFLSDGEFIFGLTASFNELMQVWKTDSPENRQTAADRVQQEASILEDLIEGLHEFLGHEGLELTYRVTMGLFDRNPELLVLIHLHNMLCQKGYLKKPLETLRLLETQFARCLFRHGKAPTSHFYTTLQPMLQEFFPHESLRVQCLSIKHQRLLRQWLNKDVNLHAELDIGAYKLFNEKSDLVLYREAKWDVDRIHDRDLKLRSCLSKVRLQHTKTVLDPSTGQQRIRDTELKRRLADNGMSEEEIAAFTPQTVAPVMIDESTSSSGRCTGDYYPFEIGNRDLFTVLRFDITCDLVSTQPFSGFNYLAIQASCIHFFSEIFRALDEAQNKTWMAVRKSCKLDGRFLALSLAIRVLKLGDQDEECLKLIAEALDSNRCHATAISHIYWHRIMVPYSVGGTKKNPANGEGDSLVGDDPCCVM
ncbi:hypothetical protein QBC41DRAFT_257934 [Cercophora samala]|uniref:DUF6604 domain-containing protein n=1 Tax=Cercophora samala TaxID=330535 RepID=A0AA40D8G5_9PEZI|nr:hypothetical protein QBC41DRAFT_257934 [Cercophora samala]